MALAPSSLEHLASLALFTTEPGREMAPLKGKGSKLQDPSEGQVPREKGWEGLLGFFQALPEAPDLVFFARRRWRAAAERLTRPSKAFIVGFRPDLTSGVDFGYILLCTSDSN